MIYAFITEHDEYAAARWAKFFEVSRSGYYAFKERLERRETERDEYKKVIKEIFNDSGGTYGAARICGILRKQGRKASYRKVSRLMADMGLSSVHNRHKSRSLTNSKKSRGDGFPNLVRGQRFDRPRQAVCSDITYLRSDEGWLYLCTVKDIVTKEILGEATGERLTKDLAIRAFLNAQARHSLAAGTIFHSDRGSQYTSGDFKATLELYGMKQSFSRVGMPGDNSWAESFFATLKKEADIRHTVGTKEIYDRRKETIERVFADAKELHGMRYAKHRGLARVKMELTLLFACMNLKKLAKKLGNSSEFFYIFTFWRPFVAF